MLNIKSPPQSGDFVIAREGSAGEAIYTMMLVGTTVWIAASPPAHRNDKHENSLASVRPLSEKKNRRREEPSGDWELRTITKEMARRSLDRGLGHTSPPPSPKTEDGILDA